MVMYSKRLRLQATMFLQVALLLLDCATAVSSLPFPSSLETVNNTKTKYKSNNGNQKSQHYEATPQISLCLSEECFVADAQEIARVWTPRPLDNWCIRTNVKKYPWKGLLLVKVPKTASSTMSGIILRLANLNKCKAVEWTHRPGRNYRNRDLDASFLIGSVRQPATRATSSYFFRISSGKIEKAARASKINSDNNNNRLRRRQLNERVNTNIQASNEQPSPNVLEFDQLSDEQIVHEEQSEEFQSGQSLSLFEAAEKLHARRIQQNLPPPIVFELEKEGRFDEARFIRGMGEQYGSFQHNYLRLNTTNERPVQVRQWIHEYHHIYKTIAAKEVSELLRLYDFLVVTERMDESLTLLSMLTGVGLGHVLLTSNSKVGGSFVLFKYGAAKGTCVELEKPIVPEGVYEDFFETEDWVYPNYVDYLLHAAVNASLDKTIESVGRKLFEKKLSEYRAMRKLVEDECGIRIGTGCTADGEKIIPEEKCYASDFGCGYECVDEVLRKHGMLEN